MLYLYTILATLVLLLIYMRFEAGFLEVRRIDFSAGKESLKVIQLSDIHIGRLKVPADRIKKAIDNERPDLVIMTGDYIEHKSEVGKFLDFVDKINGDYPIYACLGNHDFKAFTGDPDGFGEYKKLLQSKGINLLHNQTACFEKNFKRYNITGIADIKYGEWNIKEALASRCEDAHVTIAFTHNPDAVLSIPEKAVDYLLTGHFHGGQVWLPFNLEFITLRKEKLCRSGIKKGMHCVNGINLYINRGIGNVALPIRFLSRPEITVLNIP